MALYSSIAMACASAIRQRSVVSRRPSTTDGSDGATGGQARRIATHYDRCPRTFLFSAPSPHLSCSGCDARSIPERDRAERAVSSARSPTLTWNPAGCRALKHIKMTGSRGPLGNSIGAGCAMPKAELSGKPIRRDIFCRTAPEAPVQGHIRQRRDDQLRGSEPGKAGPMVALPKDNPRQFVILAGPKKLVTRNLTPESCAHAGHLPCLGAENISPDMGQGCPAGKVVTQCLNRCRRAVPQMPPKRFGPRPMQRREQGGGIGCRIQNLHPAKSGRGFRQVRASVGISVSAGPHDSRHASRGCHFASPRPQRRQWRGLGRSRRCCAH